jgi:hypothetical protein
MLEPGEGAVSEVGSPTGDETVRGAIHAAQPVGQPVAAARDVPDRGRRLGITRAGRGDQPQGAVMVRGRFVVAVTVAPRRDDRLILSGEHTGTRALSCCADGE